MRSKPVVISKATARLSPTIVPFRFRNKIGLDVAIEALKDCRRKKAATIDELWEAAKVCRMSKVMKPYMEAVV